MRKRKIFFVTTELPGIVGGSPVRNYNLIKSLNHEHYLISLFSIVDKKSKLRVSSLRSELDVKILTVPGKSLSLKAQLWKAISKRIVPYMEEYASSNLKTILMNEIENDCPDIIQLEQLNAYYAIRDIIPHIKAKKIKIILDAHNFEQIIFLETLKMFHFFKRLIGFWILPELIRLEKEAVFAADCVLTCSEIDRTYFLKTAPRANVAVIANGVDTEHFNKRKHSLKSTLLFMGSASYPPNEEALKYYLYKIHPHVICNTPSLKVILLCGNAPRWLVDFARNDASIILPGFVDDVRLFIDQATVCISPILSGSGTSLKILEYLSSAKPVVSTAKGVRGINVTNGIDIIITDNNREFAKKITLLLKEPDTRDLIGKKGRELVLSYYDWKIINIQMQAIYSSIVDGSSHFSEQGIRL